MQLLQTDLFFLRQRKRGLVTIVLSLQNAGSAHRTDWVK